MIDTADRTQRPVGARRARDEHVFSRLVKSHHAAMVRVAETYVPSTAVAEEVVLEAWLAIIKELPSVDSHGGSSLRTWIFSILVNHARARRVTPEPDGLDEPRPCVDPNRFAPEGHPRAGHWTQPPTPFNSLTGRLADDALCGVVDAAIRGLPQSEQRVVWLRDVQGWTAAEVNEALRLSEANQRRLLHHGRATLIVALERLHAARSIHPTDPGRLSGSLHEEAPQ